MSGETKKCPGRNRTQTADGPTRHVILWRTISMHEIRPSMPLTYSVSGCTHIGCYLIGRLRASVWNPSAWQAATPEPIPSRKIPTEVLLLQNTCDCSFCYRINLSSIYRDEYKMRVTQCASHNLANQPPSSSSSAIAHPYLSTSGFLTNFILLDIKY
jgi:hypothetical protein